MKIEISEKSSNEVAWEMLKPGDVVSWGGNLFLAISIGARNVQFLNLDEFKVVTFAYVMGLSGLPVLMDATLQVSQLAALPKFKDPWEYKEIDSSFIESAQYNKETNEFMIFIEGKGVYKYKDVPEYIWDDFLNAWSHGAYYNSEIKGQFERKE